MTLRRHREATSLAAALGEKSRFRKCVDYGKTVLTAATVVAGAFGLLLHGIGYVRQQANYEPRLAHLEAVGAANAAILARLDTDFVPREQINQMRSERDRHEQQFEQRLEHMDDSMTKIQNALTILVTRSR